jgi:adenylate kinase family enzyme
VIIVLEGPDGAGKTTLAEAIQKINPKVRYLHLTYRWKNRAPLYYNAALMHALQLAEKCEAPVIIDRWWPSEMIYAKVFRGGSTFPTYARILDRMLIRFGGVYVFCVPSDETAYKRQFIELTETRSEMYTSVEKMLQVRHEYLRLLYGENATTDVGYLRHCIATSFGSRWDTLTYDMHQWSLEKMEIFAASILEKVDILHKIQGSPTLSDNTISGNVGGRYLFIGDRVNKKWGPHRPEWPFFEDKNCSLWLSKTLDEFNLREPDLCFVNANHPDGIYQIKKLTTEHKFERIFVFGTEAEAAIVNVGLHLDYVGLPHPQAARRFPSYAKLFKTKLVKELVSNA